ncbi:hypothetical protein HT585_13460 [Ensifer sp. HO-A22]|uniref:Uncharacterized protein n=1 Tax=Ensifer oleiphilus TaxID=2742698 RepID=A0A7Y6Q6B4_9HYPH|nr:hypothetical protein [Ensifer oleiphilus]NVD39868.1 hypothetical protein [Ensifer oleiphilus]
MDHAQFAAIEFPLTLALGSRHRSVMTSYEKRTANLGQSVYLVAFSEMFPVRNNTGEFIVLARRQRLRFEVCRNRVVLVQSFARLSFADSSAFYYQSEN